jgi:hypothetical protein
MTEARAFRGFRFPAEVILWAVRWYLQFPISYRDLERMLADRSAAVDHTTMYRWVQHFAPELEKRMRRHLRCQRRRENAPLPRAMVRRRDIHPGQRAMALPVPGCRRHRPDNRLPAQRQAGQEGSQALLHACPRPGSENRGMPGRRWS